MKHNFTEQSKAVKQAKGIIERNRLSGEEFRDKLECAAQTLAALNWTKHLPDEGRDEYFEKITSRSADYFEDDGSHDSQMKEEILSMSYDVIQSQSSELKEKEKRIAELEEALREYVCAAQLDGQLTESEVLVFLDKFESLLNKTN